MVTPTVRVLLAVVEQPHSRPVCVACALAPPSIEMFSPPAKRKPTYGRSASLPQTPLVGTLTPRLSPRVRVAELSQSLGASPSHASHVHDAVLHWVCTPPSCGGGQSVQVNVPPHPSSVSPHSGETSAQVLGVQPPASAFMGGGPQWRWPAVSV
jgi:hypothetical protein